MHVTAIELELLLSEVDCSMTNRIVYQARSGMDTQFVAIPKSSAKLSNNITESHADGDPGLSRVYLRISRDHHLR
jgi:hypothetical protein